MGKDVRESRVITNAGGVPSWPVFSDRKWENGFALRSVALKSYEFATSFTFLRVRLGSTPIMAFQIVPGAFESSAGL